MDKRDIEISVNAELVEKNKKLQSIINKMKSDYYDKGESLERLINELDQIKTEWFEALNDLNIQREEYKKLNRELLDIKIEMNKIRKYL